ncbi:PREDICTED: uncharacterized protein LOC108552949 [Eufriesea mexicana]|uniref:uncharacterized protein LOC108552949 n=1 Tax=Eufriesea mexicana TaxID=516756 RepID=UPI00083C6146|nr:PREDICTED: uncharacterized protein LOC108552949 [Eufriesea mexicana]
MRNLLLLVTIHEFLRPVQSVNGVIWDKELEDFVPIFSVPAFAAVNHELMNRSRELELYNFQGRIVKFSYYEETNIINSRANGTEVTGVIGEIWNILSEYLNFTLKPILTKEQTVGIADSKGKFSIGLLSHIERNETDVIARVEAHIKRSNIIQFTIPLWKTKYRLYIRREVKYVPTWMLKLFSRKVWFMILLMYFMLSFCSYLSQAGESKVTNKYSKTNLNDHFFYNFGMICGQGYFPSCSSKSSRIVELWLGLFSCLIRTAFGALLIGYMTQTTETPPFEDLNSLLDTTSYNILTINGSLPTLLLQAGVSPEYNKTTQLRRHTIVNTEEEMYKTTCLTGKLWAIFQSADMKKARGIYFCRLNPAGKSMFTAWIVSGISWNFKHKRSIDVGILKLYEVGFMDLLKYRWIESKNVEEEVLNKTEPIMLEQVYLILLIFSGGLLISFIILLFENLIFYCKNK